MYINLRKMNLEEAETRVRDLNLKKNPKNKELGPTATNSAPKIFKSHDRPENFLARTFNASEEDGEPQPIYERL